MSHQDTPTQAPTTPAEAQRELTRRQSPERVDRALSHLVREGKIDPDHLRLAQLIGEVLCRELHHQFSLHELEHAAQRLGTSS